MLAKSLGVEVARQDRRSSQGRSVINPQRICREETEEKMNEGASSKTIGTLLLSNDTELVLGEPSLPPQKIYRA
jgi:hypothetical protein